MRLFFAILLPDEIIRALQGFQEDLRGDAGEAGLRWTRPEQFHLTLKFLGEQSRSRARTAVEAAELLRERPPFELAVGGLGAFPNSARPSNLWLAPIEEV